MGYHAHLLRRRAKELFIRFESQLKIRNIIRLLRQINEIEVSVYDNNVCSGKKTLERTGQSTGAASFIINLE